tara:strand:- start:6 stop:227 length:222 start_codon:yes stop_codon:yes gene_type:complete
MSLKPGLERAGLRQVEQVEQVEHPRYVRYYETMCPEHPKYLHLRERSGALRGMLHNYPEGNPQGIAYQSRIKV